jgi:NitT/TauT family transport system substrate-binding protein
MSVIHRAIVGAGAFAFGAGVMLSSALAADKLTFYTNWYAQAEHGGFYQAKATGLYEEAGLDVTISMGGPQVNVMQLLVAGQADIIMGYDLQTLTSVQEGLPVVAVATTFQNDLRCILAHGDVEDLADLKDNTILVASGGRVSWWPWLMSEYGFSDEQVQPYTFNLQPFFTNEDIAQQCYVSSEPMQARDEGIDHTVFLLSDYGWPSYASPLITRRDFLEENRDVVRRFVEASMQGWKSYMEDPEPGNELIKQDNPNMTDEQIAFGLEQFEKYDLLAGGDARQGGIGTITEERWKELYDFMVGADLLDPDTDWRSAFTTEIIDEINVTLD